MSNSLTEAFSYLSQLNCNIIIYVFNLVSWFIDFFIDLIDQIEHFVQHTLIEIRQLMIFLWSLNYQIIKCLLIILTSIDNFFNYVFNFNFVLLESIVDYIIILYILMISVCTITIIYFTYRIYLLRKQKLEQSGTLLLNYLCCICKIENSQIVLMPCKHLCLCSSCYFIMHNVQGSRSNCPICRALIQNKIQIFLT